MDQAERELFDKAQAELRAHSLEATEIVLGVVRRKANKAHQLALGAITVAFISLAMAIAVTYGGYVIQQNDTKRTVSIRRENVSVVCHLVDSTRHDIVVYLRSFGQSPSPDALRGINLFRTPACRVLPNGQLVETHPGTTTAKKKQP